mgnify:CR=1 FL=1
MGRDMLGEPDDFRRAGRMNGIEISGIVHIAETAAQMCADGNDIVSLPTDAPDFPTPDFVVAAAHDVIVPSAAFSLSGHVRIYFAYS